MKIKLSFFVFLLLPLSSYSAVYENTCTVSGTLIESDNLESQISTDSNFQKSYESGINNSGVFTPTLHKFKSFLRCTDGNNIIPCSDSSYVVYQSLYDVYKNYSVSCPSSLSDYDDDPQGCSNAGGVYYMSHTKQVGGTTYFSGFFGGPGITLGGDIVSVNKCGTYGEALGLLASNAIAFAPFLSNLLKTNAAKNAASRALTEYLYGRYGDGTFTGSPYNATLQIPKITPATTIKPGSDPTIYNSPSGSSGVSFPISESPIPQSTNSSGITGPSSAPSLSIAEAYEKFLNETYFPTASTSASNSTPQGDPIINHSTIDRFNTISDITHEPQLSEVVPPVGTTQKPVKETVDLSKYYTGRYSVPEVAETVSATTTKTQTYSGNDPVDNYVTTISYPDGSTAQQTVSINKTNKQGTVSHTTVSPGGDTNTLNLPIYVPYYTGSLDGPTIQAPLGSTYTDPESNPIPSSTSPNTTGTTPISPSSTSPSSPSTTSPDTVTNQDPSSIINANMPSYSLPSLSDFVLFDSTPISDLLTSSAEMFSNIENQIASTKSVFDDTLTLINGGWNPPVIPQGACGDSMAFNFHGRRVDLCPPLVNESQKFSPIVSSVTTIGGMAFSLVIIIGGF